MYRRRRDRRGSGAQAPLFCCPDDGKAIGSLRLLETASVELVLQTEPDGVEGWLDLNGAGSPEVLLFKMRVAVLDACRHLVGYYGFQSPTDREAASAPIQAATAESRVRFCLEMCPTVATQRVGQGGGVYFHANAAEDVKAIVGLDVDQISESAKVQIRADAGNIPVGHDAGNEIAKVVIVTGAEFAKNSLAADSVESDHPEKRNIVDNFAGAQRTTDIETRPVIGR